MRSTTILLAVGLALTAGAVQAQTPGVSSTAGPVPLNGIVPSTCTVGSLQGDDDVFALGVMVNTTTGFLLPSLTAPPKTLVGAYCNTRSRIEIAATPLIAQDFADVPPAGFSKSVDFTATASGWTTVPASYRTGAAAQPDAAQIRETAFTGDVQVAVSNFVTTGGPSLRPVADPEYRGSVVVTLTAAD